MPKGPYMRGVCRQETLHPILIIFGISGHIHDVITLAIFYRFRINGSGVTSPRKVHFYAYFTAGLTTLLRTNVGASDKL